VRAGCAVPGVAEEPVLAIRSRDVAVTAVVLALTAVAFAAVADHGILAHIQRADDWWLRLMTSGRLAPVTLIAKIFNVLGSMSRSRSGSLSPASWPCAAAGGTWPRSPRPWCFPRS
jgi:hypothetical protein